MRRGITDIIRGNGESAVGPPKQTLPTTDEINTLLGKVQEGDTSVLPALRHLLDTAPVLALVLGDLARNAQQAIIRNAVGDNEGMRVCTERAVGVVEKDLAGESPSPVEELLAQRIALDWLYLHYVEALEAQWMRDGSRILAQADHSQKRVDRAHRRYLRSLKTLATVRRLLTPAVRMKVGVHAHQHLHTPRADGDGGS
jgi:hypothetical protein